MTRGIAMGGRAKRTPFRRDDRVLRSTRLTAALLVPILVTAAVILYLFPDDTERLFAWPIRPRATALVMGAGYLTGAYFFGRLALASLWHRAGTPLLSLCD